MLYLLDANVLIDANRDYYPIDRIPEFWDWLIYMGQEGHVKMPIETYEEITKGNDVLAAWAKSAETKSTLSLQEEPEPRFVEHVVIHGYAPDLDDGEVERLGQDPFLIAYALKSPDDRCVVTTEISKPTKQRANRRVPDVCQSLGIKSCHTYKFLQALDFRTDWTAHI